MLSLQEEYFTRHNLNCPTCRIQPQACLIFRQPKKKIPWFLLSIDSTPVNNHPNEYTITRMTPVYGGVVSRHFTAEVIGKCSFDTYQDTMTNMLNQYIKLGMKPVLDLIDAEVACMEIFIYCLGSSVVDSASFSSFDVIDNIAQLIRCSDLNAKRAVYNKIDKTLNGCASFSSVWTSFRHYTKPDFYATWAQSMVSDSKCLS